MFSSSAGLIRSHGLQKGEKLSRLMCINAHLYKETENLEQFYSLNVKTTDVTQILPDLYLLPLLVFRTMVFSPRNFICWKICSRFIPFSYVH